MDDSDSNFKDEQRKRIIENHPNLYSEKICFECSNGWLDLIEELSGKLESLIIKYYRSRNDEEIDINFYAVKVKEKFGTLRFYLNMYTEEMDDLIYEAEAKSAITCELCGKPGKTVGVLWLETLCEKCNKEELK